MASFAVDRNNMNRGTGERSGVWIFEEFMFADSVFGRAVVEYDANAIRVKNEDREVGALMSAPYEMKISGAKVTFFEIFNDDGEQVCSATFTDNFIAFGLIHDPGVSPAGTTLMIEGAGGGRPVGGYWGNNGITGASHLFTEIS